MKYHIIVFGCQMNISDSERVAYVLESIKYKKTENVKEADLVVIVMCSIRQSAVDRVFGLVNSLKKKPTLILTGCVLKKDKKKFDEVFDVILDIKDINNIPKILQNKKISTKKYLSIEPVYSNKFSAEVPIMTGCNNFCAYCVVPYVRGREISRPSNDIICEVKKLASRGYKEVWLLGQNVNSYKDKGINFPKLLKMVNDISGNFWIRFTSSHPKDFSDNVISALGIGGKITPYLNLPIQSGDDEVLKLMNRHYTVKDYMNKIKKLRKKIPGIALSTDIIVGFPGETEKQFENTVKLFKNVKYDMAYINKYSTRASTAAAKLKDNISINEKKRREKVLTEILKKTALEKNKNFIGKEVAVLINENRDGNYFGKDEHYKTIKVKSDKNILGEFVKVKITEALPFILKGELIK